MGAVGAIAPAVFKESLIETFAPTALKDSKILEKIEKLHPQYKIPNTTPDIFNILEFISTLQ